MPWQLHVLAGITAYDVDGRWLHRQAYLSVARQNGKSTLNAALVGWWLTTQGAARGEPQTVITVAHDLSLAQSFFGYLAPILETHFGAKPSWSYGRSKVTMPDGSVWYARAATPNAGHGFSCSLIVADEIWQISEAAIDDGLLPSQRAKKNPLLLMTSTAGTQESHVMLRWRDQGLRQIDSGEPGPLYFAEYSPPAIDPMTPEAWAYANPALGHTLELDVIAAEAQSPNRAAFLRASVNLWQATSQGWLEPGLFAALACDDPQPAGGVLAIESSLDDSRYTGVRAVQTGDKTHVALAFVANSMAELWRHVDQITKENPTLRLAVTPGLDIHVPPHLETRRVIVGYKELLKWTATVRAMIVENRIKHNGEQTLTQQVERAVLVKHQGAIAVSSTRSPGPIEACRCMIWAAALASKPQLVGKPSIGGAFR
jgi:phage terminase large subunit-like protein